MISSNYFNECNSLFPCELETSEMSQMELGPNDWNSIYIPVIPNNMWLTNVRGETHRFHPKHVSYFLEKLLKVGKVRRVDFIDRNIENHSTPVKGAFVHFDYWYNNNITQQIQFNMSNNIQSMFSYEAKSYWLIDRNVNPLDEEDVKLHRIIDEQQNIIMKCCGYNCGDFQYKYKDNVLINTFHFINPVNKCKKKLNSIINFQQNIINSILV